MKSDKIDSRFIHDEPPKWRQGQKQFLWGSEYITISPTTKNSTLYEYELPMGSTIMFGNQSGFYVRGSFQYKEKAADADSTFKPVPASESANVALVPNWFDHLFKDPQLYHGNMPLNPHDVPRYSDAYLNTYLYAHMYPDTKKCLLPEPHAPGHYASTKTDDYDIATTTSMWSVYANKIFGKSKIEFKYVPLHVFPFMQQPNFCIDGRPPAALPLQILQKMTVQLQAKEDQSSLFWKKTGVTSVYRFKIESIDLIVEEARLNPTLERPFLNQKGSVYYSGLTKFAMAENISAGVQQHKLRFQDVPMPEGLFIFALAKTALSGVYPHGTATGQVFNLHNINELFIHFNNMPLAIKSPHIGEVNSRVLELKQLRDHYEMPPFGVLQDPQYITYANIKEGGKNSAFPHVYIPFCPSGKETRIVPVGADGQVINKNGDLDITIKFGSGGAKDATYLAYIFYTDVNMILDLSTQTFSPVYKRSKTN
jgi:hypothetical protein